VTTSRSLAVVSAGIGQPSSSRLLADRLAAATQLASRDHAVDLTIEVVELREHAHDVTNNLLTGFVGEGLRRATETVGRADGLVAVTPIFSGSYSGLFKTFFDILDEDTWTGTPVLIGATGGTARHSLALDHALRPLFSYLRAVVGPTGVYAATADWGATGNEALTVRIDRAAGELAALIAAAPVAGTDTGEPEFTPFSELLRGS
jgi:FMN reductase